jgi:hypothetical protein
MLNTRKQVVTGNCYENKLEMRERNCPSKCGVTGVKSP